MGRRRWLVLDWFAGAWGGAFLVVLSLVAGTAWALVAAGDGGACARWIAVASTVVLSLGTVLRQSSIDRETNRIRRHLEESASSLPGLVSTMPGEEALTALNLGFEKGYVVVHASPTPERLADALQFLLKAVVGAAQVFDGGCLPPSPPVCANVMWFVPRDSKLAALWDPHVKFRNPGASLSGTQGLLAVSPRFSAAAGDPAETPDPHLLEFAIDVADAPKTQSQDGERYRVLPGAPLVFVDLSKFEFFHPARDMAAWMESHGDFAPSVREAVAGYFGSQTQIAGLFSVPLYEPKAEYDKHVDRTPIAVLNIHWGSGARLLKNAMAAGRLAAALYPLRVLLGAVVQQMVAADQVPRPGGNP